MGAEKGNMQMTFDTPSFMTKACEIFVQELAFRAWMRASSHHRSVILDTDIAEAIATTESCDFLKDILHTFREEHNSISCSKSSEESHISTHQPSTSHHSPLNKVPWFHPQYPPSVCIPHLCCQQMFIRCQCHFHCHKWRPPRPITMMAPINYMATSLWKWY
jgi:nuclear transcription factor Y, gamma